MVFRQSLSRLGLLIRCVIPSFAGVEIMGSHAAQALDVLEKSLDEGFSGYLRLLGPKACVDAAVRFNDILCCLRSAQASLRVLSGDLDERRRPLVAGTAGVARVITAIFLYRKLLKFTLGVKKQVVPPDLRVRAFSLDEQRALEALNGKPIDIRIVAGLFRACGIYGCRLLEARMSGNRPELLVAGVYYRSCCRSLTLLVKRAGGIDDSWRKSVERLNTAFS